MAPTVGSTAASAADQEKQEKVDVCVTMLIQLLARDPWITVDEILNYLTWIGPAFSVGRLAHISGGRAISKRALARMGIIRQARAQDTSRMDIIRQAH